MRISSFHVESQRSIVLVECDAVPRVMIIAGPNGCGKSTLLDCLRRQPGSGPILYAGPHRSMRRQSVQMRHLLGAPISLGKLLAQPDTPGYEGISLIGGTRDPWGYDDTGNYLKHALCQIEIDRTRAIASLYDNQREILRDSFPDPWTPLRELTNNLLPHLAFDHVDATDRQTVRCYWRVHGADTPVDLDDLSSGEKSIIQMFYPLIEQQIRRILGDIIPDHSETEQLETCVLIDEPELHLHPNLQAKVVDYLRILGSDSGVQFIVATHSPTIVEHATHDELYLLRPPDLVPTGTNQLVQVAGDEDHLQLLRERFGTTSNLTAMQPIVVVEGSRQTTDSQVVSDRKLYRRLHAAFDRVLVLPGGGKSECQSLQRTLTQAVQALSTELMVTTLLDRDLETDTSDREGYLLPVSMIENFLLDPEAIWEAIQSVIEKTEFSSVDDLAVAIDGILDEMEIPEIERRTIDTLGTAFFRAKQPADEIPSQLETFIAQLESRYSSEAITIRKKSATQAVNEFKDTQQRRERFHGKDAMARFFGRYLHSTGMAKPIFLFETARYARRRRSVTGFFDDFFKKLGVTPATIPAQDGDAAE